MATNSTRQQMVDTAVELFQRHGYRATSWRTLVRAGNTPWGSVQHHFPGGKEELGVAAVERAGELVEALLRATIDGAGDPVSGIRAWFATSAALLESSGHTSGCPVAPVVLEVGSDAPELMGACSAALQRWVGVVADALVRAGVDHTASVALATTVVSGFEGALVLARAQHSTAPLVQVGDVLASTIANALP